MPKENNKMQVDIDTLKKQNVNDLLSIKELYKRIEELGEKISKFKYIDNTLIKKLKKEYERLKEINFDVNLQIKLINDIETINSQIDNKVNKDVIETINSQLGNSIRELKDSKADTVFTNSLQSQINNLVLQEGNPESSSAEILQARGNFSVLNDRFDNIDYKLNDVIEESNVSKKIENITNGYRLSATGIKEVQSGWSIGEITVTSGEKYYLTINVYKVNQPFAAFLNSNNEVISCIKGRNASGWYLEENYPIIIPANCVKMVVSTSSSTINNAFIYKTNGYEIIGLQDVQEKTSEINSIMENDFTELDLEWISNSFWNKNNGSVSVLSNCNRTSIDVAEGEIYIISTTGYGYANPYILLDAGGNKILSYPDVSLSKDTTYENLEVIIPLGCKKLCINSITRTSPLGTVKKKTGVLPKGVGEIKTNIKGFNTDIDFIRNCYEKAIISEQLKNDFAWKEFDKIYITFTFDDSNPDISDIETLFENKNVPCCFATVPIRLNNTTNSGEKVKEVLQRAETNGGEVLAHWQEPLTSESTDQDYYNVYIGAKKTLTQAGFDVNGLIVAGGTNYQTQDWKKGVKLARPYYRYSDLIGQSQNITQYNHQRKFLTTNDKTNKDFIDRAISEGNQWLSFASHGANDNVTIDLLSSLLDYIATKPNVKIVNFKYLYDTFGTTKLEKRLMALENK